MTAITFSSVNPALLLQIYPSCAPRCGTAPGFASETCWNGHASVAGRYSDTVWLKAVEMMGNMKEKASKGKHLFSLPLATSGTFLIIEMLKLAEVAEWIDLVII